MGGYREQRENRCAEGTALGEWMGGDNLDKSGQRFQGGRADNSARRKGANGSAGGEKEDKQDKRGQKDNRENGEEVG